MFMFRVCLCFCHVQSLLRVTEKRKRDGREREIRRRRKKEERRRRSKKKGERQRETGLEREREGETPLGWSLEKSLNNVTLSLLSHQNKKGHFDIRV